MPNTIGAPPVLGVWKSWEGTNHDADGRPIAPNYNVKTMPSTDTDSRFVGYMFSGASVIKDPTSADLNTLVLSEAGADTIPMLSMGSLGEPANVGDIVPGQVHLQPQLLDTGTKPGAYAWWVSGENQKARLTQPYSPRTDDEYGWSTLAKSHAVPDVGFFGLEELADDPEQFHERETGDKGLKKAVSRKSMRLLKQNNTLKPHESFHDYSSSSLGLLTNSATGGWRKDLTLLSERWDQIYNTYGVASGTPATRKLPLFRYRPVAGATSAAVKPVGTPVASIVYDPPQSNLYPWSSYVKLGVQSAARVPMAYVAASSSWLSMVNYINSYKTISVDSSLTMPNRPITWDKNLFYGATPTDFYNIYHGTDYQPIIARNQYILQVNAIPDPMIVDPATARNFHRINMRVVPIITIWNPYNIELTKSINQDIGLQVGRSLPTVLSIINGTAPPLTGHTGNYMFINGGSSETIDNRVIDWDYSLNTIATKRYLNSYFGGGTRAFASYFPRSFTLKPGEVKVFSPGFNSYHIMHNVGIRLKEGYATGDDFGLTLVTKDKLPPLANPVALADANRLLRPRTSRNINGTPGGQTPLFATDSLRFAVKADRTTRNLGTNYSDSVGAGTFFTLGASRWPGPWIAQDVIGTYEQGAIPKGVSYFKSVNAVAANETWAQKYWPASKLREVQYTVSDLVPGGGNPDWTNVYTISFGPRLAFGAGYGSDHNRPTKGLLQSNPFAQNAFSIPEMQASFHPANGVFDLSYESMTFNSSLSPEVGNSGYAITGYQSGDGISRMIMAEIPLAPLASLAELQSWNLRGINPLPPHQFNLIGNSDATPMIPKDSVVIASPAVIKETPTSKPFILQHDDAYCGNHLLFDDWFFSTIAPQPSNFGNTIAKDLTTVYRDFIQGTDMLTNRAYRTIPEDTKLPATQATALVNTVINSPTGDSWLKIASRLEVEGMFNVNSTSVKAWRALLGHARNRQVAYYTANGIGLDTTERDHVVSRNTVAADIEAGSAPGTGAAFPNGSEYSGFRTLSNDQLDELAEKIVEQVRIRGPFLSLSEFVNRQLSSDEDLAIAGALQVAIDSLTDDPNEALKDSTKQLSEITLADMDKALLPADKKMEGSGYENDTVGFSKAAEGFSSHGFPGWVRQADILRPLAPIISVRDDTFTIRAYGDVRDENGNITAQAWCEATVQRTRDFVNSSDLADTIEPPINTENLAYGRRYVITSFRWLSPDEV